MSATIEGQLSLDRVKGYTEEEVTLGMSLRQPGCSSLRSTKGINGTASSTQMST